MSQMNHDLMPTCPGPSVSDVARVSATLAEMCRWYWHARKWVVDVNIYCEFYEVASDPVTATLECIATVPFEANQSPAPPTVEKDLVCQHYTDVTLDLDATLTVGGSPSFITLPVRIQIFNGDGVTTPVWQYVDGVAYPMMVVSYDEGLYFAATTRDDFEFTTVGVTFDGKTPFAMQQPQTDPISYPDGATTQTGTITVTPRDVADSFWEYAPTSGGDPVFDDEDGTQINPNVVID